MRLGILGGGRAAWAYGNAWRNAGWPLAGVWLRPQSTSRLPELLDAPRSAIEALAASSDLLLLAVSDRAIDPVAEQIPDCDAVVFHASGALTSVRGGFSLHPLAALPPVGEPVELRGRLLVFEGAHQDVAARIAERLGARISTISPEAKARYHAGAVFGSNYVALMLDIADGLISLPAARADLAALARTAIDNWLSHEDGRRFTGPAARGDDQVMELHRRALAADDTVREIYIALALEVRRRLIAPSE